MHHSSGSPRSFIHMPRFNGGIVMSSNDQSSIRPTRRSLLQAGAAVTAAGALARLAQPASMARTLNAPTFGSQVYDTALQAQGGVKGVFQSPYYDATIVSGEHLNHLLLLQMKNWLNGFQFSYQMAPEDLHTIVASYASANILTYGDPVWEKYRIGEKYNIIDPATGKPACRAQSFLGIAFRS
jgi:hypothetical protein